MRIDPALRALRSDPAPQRQAQARVEQAKRAWQSDPLVAQVSAGLKSYGAGEEFENSTELRGLFASGGRGTEYVALLVEYFRLVLADEPLAQMPFRHDYRDSHSTLVLGSEGSATLSLHCSAETVGVPAAPAKSVRFSSGQRHEVTVAGAADIRLVERKSRADTAAGLSIGKTCLRAGDVLKLNNDLQATIVDKVHGRLMRLRLVRTSPNAAPSQQYLIESGALIHQAAGSQSDSRQELMLALLGRMERADAAPVMADMTKEGSDHLRWQAIRECLALNTATGFDALCHVAITADDPLAAPAGALRAQLLEAYPALAALNEETVPCPV